jgi:type I restriction enzyme M protein
MQADGFSLDDKRQPIEKNDIADIVTRFKSLQDAPLFTNHFSLITYTEGSRLRTDKSFLVPVEEIRDNKYDLSINRYKEVVYEEKTYLKPQVIIQNIEDLDAERRVLMNELKMLLG